MFPMGNKAVAHNMTTKTTCPYCGVGCGILATPQPDGTLDIKGDPDHPANFGRLCSKGSALGQTMGLDGRLLTPQKDGKSINWENAIAEIASKFNETIDAYGPNSVAFYVSGQILTEDYYVANKLMKGYIGAANIDTNSRLCMASSVAGHRRAFGSDTVPGIYQDFEQADLIVLTGSNLAWCHPVIYQRIEAAKEQNPNLKVVLIDPRRTMTNQIADMHLAIQPDGDVALFRGLLAYLSAHNCLNSGYIEDHTNGFEAALINAQELSQSELCHQTGLSQTELQDFYKLFANTEKVVTAYSQGVNQSVSGTDKVNSIINCHLATGRIGRQGMGPFSLTGQPNAMGGREVGGLANMLACHMNIENSAHRDIVQNFWQSPRIASEHGLKAVDLFNAVADGQIKALWIMGTNPVDSMPDASSVENAIKNCPFVVVSDVLEDTDTTQYADIKLPSLAWGEKDGTVTNSERCISRQKSFLPAPSQAKPDWWQMAEVAKAMGYQNGFNFDGPSDVFKEYAALSAFENNGSRDFNIGAFEDIDAASYNEIEPSLWPKHKSKSDENKIRFFGDGNFFTPDKKANFVIPDEVNSNFIDIAYPLVLNTGRIRDHWHTMTRTGKSERLSAHIAEPFCEIHPSDAVRFKINTASLVNIKSPHGSILLRALITDRTQGGSIFVPMHWTDQFAANARVDKLVTADVDPFSGQPALKTSKVQISPFTAELYGFAVCREEPKNIDLPYWAKAKCEGGWRIEFATGAGQTNFVSVIRSVVNKDYDDASVAFKDETTSRRNFAWFDGDQLEAALYLAPNPVEVSRVWATANLKSTFENHIDRSKIAAGRPGGDMPDRGAIVCSCYSVGMNEISAAVRAGHISVKAIGECLQAGTNCGSCKSEISGIIDEHHILAAE